MKQLKVLFFALLAVMGVACSSSDDAPARNYLDGKTFNKITTDEQGSKRTIDETTLKFNGAAFSLVDTHVVMEGTNVLENTKDTREGTYTYENNKLTQVTTKAVSEDLVKKESVTIPVDKYASIQPAVNESTNTITLNGVVLTLKK